MSDRTVKPIAGTCYVLPDARLGVMEGGIIIPEVGRQTRARTGKCVARTLYVPGTRYILWHGTRGKQRSVAASKWNPIYDDLVGKYVAYRTGVVFDNGGEQVCRVRLEHVLAICDEPLKVIAEDIERCPFCKSKGEGNMLLDPHGYCVQCGKNLAGEHRDERVIKVSDDDVEVFGKTPKELMRERMPNRPADKPERVFSYPGQDRRG